MASDKTDAVQEQQLLLLGQIEAACSLAAGGCFGTMAVVCFGSSSPLLQILGALALVCSGVLSFQGAARQTWPPAKKWLQDFRTKGK